MATPTDIDVVSRRGATGSIQFGTHRQVIQSVGATRTLLAKEAGALCLLDAAAGNIYTLPVPVEGMTFEFLQTVSVTSNAAKVITNSASVFLLGSVTAVTIATASPAGFSANGTSIVTISQNGTTSGGLIGSSFKLTAISATQWGIDGVIVGSGVIVTPFA